jgi:hypothetical protein
MTERAKLRRSIVASAVAAACLAGTAVAAQAATLHVSVKPKTSHSGKSYRVTVSGTVKRRQLAHHPYVLAVIQYAPQPCAGTAKGELKRTGANFFLHATITGTPFRSTTSFGATRLGTRRICAYLYSHPVGPTDNAKPIARASAKYFVIQ